MVSIMKGLVFG